MVISRKIDAQFDQVDMAASLPHSPTPFRHTVPKLHYQVAMVNPASHLFEVTLSIQNWHDPDLDLKLPVWTPGSYLVREYAKSLQDFIAKDASDHTLPSIKLSKNHWQVNTTTASNLTVHYAIFAQELTVRTNHLDITHGYFNPGAMFCYLPGWEQEQITVTILPPYPNWTVTTALPRVGGDSHTFVAANFDTLVDSPFEVGTHALYPFEFLGKPHQWAIWGEGNIDAQQLIEDTQKVIQVEAELFGGLPYDHYLFLLHLTEKGYGGLEHHHSCSLQYPRFSFRDPDKYRRFMSLVAHEFFHLWNVKRLRPQALQTFDYDRENYTDCLWFCEGVTSFYDQVIPLRAGISDAQWYLKQLSEAITRLQTTPGRFVQSLSQSSFDAWIKLYRPTPNSRNAEVSYYLKGELVALLLDLLIRTQHQNQRSLDDVMRHLWQQFGELELGYTSAQLKAVFETIAATDLTSFWLDYIEGTAELPFNQYLEPFGLQIYPEIPAGSPPYLGLEAQLEAGLVMVKFVAFQSPAQQAGIEVGDQLLAIAGFKVGADQLGDRLKDFQPGKQIEITLFHHDQLRICEVTLAEPVAVRYQIGAIANPTPVQEDYCHRWLGLKPNEL